MAAQESWEEREARERRENEARMKTACAVLARLGVQTIDAEYNGSGDQGCIEKIQYIPLPPAGIPEGLEDLIEDFAFRQLPPGWEINEGSSGTLRIDVRTRKASTQHQWRELDPADWLEEDQTNDWLDDDQADA